MHQYLRCRRRNPFQHAAQIAELVMRKNGRFIQEAAVIRLPLAVQKSSALGNLY